MSEYLFTGTNPSGDKVTESAKADSADTAVRLLAERGYTNIILHTGDIGARYSKQSAAARYISPREYIRFRHMGEWGYFLFLTGKLYRSNWYVIVLAVALLVYRQYFGRPFGALDVLAIISLLIPLFLAMLSLIGNPRRRYARLVDAAGWARWEEVLRLLPSLPAGVPAHEKLFREAQALAGLGRMSEALAVVEPLATDSQVPAWMYWSRLAGVCRAARDRAQALACLEQSAKLAPDNATALLDLALALLYRRRDLARAADLLRRVRTHAISDIALHFLCAAEGMLALEQGKPHEALGLLEEAMAGQSTLTTAAAGPVRDRWHAYLCLAEAGVGNTDSARRHLDQATARLRALGEDDLLTRCETALRT